MTRALSAPPTILIVAGSDSSGGAGIAADLRTAVALGAHARLAVTAVTAQGREGVRGVEQVSATMLRAQLSAGLSDGAVRAVKIGMLGRASSVEAVADMLAERAVPVPLVLDPVLAASSGGLLLDEEGIACLIAHLLPLATVLTPNLPELFLLAARRGPVTTDIEEAADRLLSAGACAVLVKGGHAHGPMAEDLLFRRGRRGGGAPRRFAAPRSGATLRGTGCALSTAIAAFLATGHDLDAACGLAKRHLAGLFEAEAQRLVGTAGADHSASNIRM